jgi:hypothetical protein
MFLAVAVGGASRNFHIILRKYVPFKILLRKLRSLRFLPCKLSISLGFFSFKKKILF